MTGCVISFTVTEVFEPIGWMPHIYDQSPLLLFAILIAPVWEELAFRLPLVFNRKNLLISTGLISLFLFKRVFEDWLTACVISSVILAILILLFYIKSSRWKEKTTHFQRANFKFIFYFYTLAFALLHVFNYTFDSGLQYIAVPFLIMPQLIYSFVFGYIRLKYKTGLLITLSIHILINSTAFLLVQSL